MCKTDLVELEKEVGKLLKFVRVLVTFPVICGNSPSAGAMGGGSGNFDDQGGGYMVRILSIHVKIWPCV